MRREENWSAARPVMVTVRGDALVPTLVPPNQTWRFGLMMVVSKVTWPVPRALKVPPLPVIWPEKTVLPTL